ncbi:MAG TPA: acid protease, partial [Dysgonomonas sp.]|nr:acid protease [Dysgonomonas sp.]
QKRDYTAIQLKKFVTGHLYLTVQINNMDAVFILDTGAGATVIDDKRESKFELNTLITDNKAVGVGGGNMALRQSIVNNFKIQDYNINDFKIHLMNLDHVNNALKRVGIEEIDGVIGADILLKGKAIIDYENLVLFLKR